MTGLAATSSPVKHLQALCADGQFTLFRGKLGDTQDPVLVVAPTQDNPQAGSLSGLAHEYELRDALEPGWAARPMELVRLHGRAALVLGDPGGLPLEQLIDGPMEPNRFLRLASVIAEAVAHAHRRGLIHKDIKPSHLLIEEEKGAAWLTGFGIASHVPSERPSPQPAESISGTLAYMAPEQTGRMNRSVDARADLYALGVTFYRMLTGRLPFAASEPMEWMHCHMARRPPPPVELCSGVPTALSAIVMKCLAKTAEDRYQTATGLAADLRRCQAEVRAAGRIAPFALAKSDIPDVLRVPEKLYGRQREVATLCAAFERVTSFHRPELVLVSGYSGIGKSSVVHELHKAIVPRRGLFAAGKFDQYKRDIPYSTLAQAFQDLIRPLLAKGDAELTAWRDSLRTALEPNGALMVNLVPELALVVGDQPPVGDLPQKDAEYRFRQTVRRFIGVFARPEHPLALFLDDLQWLDSATLTTIADLVTSPELGDLLLVGAYRDNEVNAAHPLTRSVAAIRQAGGAVHEIALPPLTRSDIGHLVADTVRCPPRAAAPLIRLVWDKTGGNPFFTIQFLTTLAEEKLLVFDAEVGKWAWDLGRIRAKGYTDNVVELMVAKLKRLPAATQEALKRLSCLGVRADVSSLALILGERAVDADLGAAVREGLVFRSAEAYSFLHDRVQEAAYTLVPAADRQALHLEIGWLLLAQHAREGRPEGVFDVVNQLNHGVDLISDADERATLRRLNTEAGRMARRAVAYASAHRHLVQAAALLPSDSWSEMYEESLSLILDLAEIEFLVGDFQRSDQLLTEVLDKARSTLDCVRIHRLRQRLYQLSGRYNDALAVTFEALRLLGMELPQTEEDVRDATATEIRQVPVSLGSRRIAELVDAPMATDAHVRATIGLIAETMPVVYTSRSALFPLTIARAVNLSLRHGNADETPFIYSCYAMVLVSLCRDIPSALQFSEMALALNERAERSAALRGKLLFHHASVIRIWSRHFATSLPLLEQAFNACLDAGDMAYAGYVTYNTVWLRLEAGEPLNKIVEAARNYEAFAQQSRHDVVYNVLCIVEQFGHSLKGATRALTDLSSPTFDEAGSAAAIERAGYRLGIAYYLVIKQIAAFLDGRCDQALEHASRAAAIVPHVAAMAIEATHYFFHALTLTALYPRCSAEDQQRFTRQLGEIRTRLELWAAHCPENFDNRLALVSAEIARVEGRDLEAMHLYERAIHSARHNGFVQNEALANELAGQFYLDRGLEKNGFAHLRDARACYARWGADGKVKNLERLYPQLATRGRSLAGETIGPTARQLDLEALIKASQAISAEIELPRLIKTLMTIILQTAGADRGLLLQPSGKSFEIRAEACAKNGTIELNLRNAPLAETECPEALVNYVIHTQKSVILDDGRRPGPAWGSEYLRLRPPRSAMCLPLLRRSRLSGALYLENSQAAYAFPPDRVALLEVLAARAAIALENAHLYADLQAREARIRRLVEANIIGILIWDVEGRIMEANEAFLRIVGYDHEDVASGRLNWAALTPPEWLDRDERIWLPELKRTGILPPFEKEYFRKDGSRVPVLIGVATFPDVPDEGVGFVLDLSERKATEERLTVMVDELNHRVKNTLATVMAISAQTVSNSPSPDAFREAFEGRLLALSQTHNLLNRSCWTGVSLREVLEQELAPHTSAEDGRRLLVGEDVHLGPVTAVTLGMAFHELATNAAKYGALSTPAGRVQVTWDHQESGRLRLEWQEMDGPPVQPRQHRGFGSKLLERLLAVELCGEVHLEFLPQGVRCTMDMALERVSSH